MYAVSAEPTIAVVDAIKAVLDGDATLRAMVTGIYGHVSETAAKAYPYLVLGRRTTDGDAGAMQSAGTIVTVQIDGWSSAKGPYEIEAIGSRVFRLLERRAGFEVPGFAVVAQSLHRESGFYDVEFDETMPQRSLYRLMQMWTVEIHES
jgi:hypothetical protein